MSVKELTPALPPSRAFVKFHLANYIETNVPLGKSHALHPLYEAIANSFDSIADTQPAVPGSIAIRVLRDMNEKVQVDTDGGKGNHPIRGFEVVDNGEGFTDKNLQSFQLGASPHKKNRGGKGLGRLVWLKVFKEASVESHYRNGAGYSTRSFKFTLKADNGVSDLTTITAPGVTRAQTVVKLLDMKTTFSPPKKPLTIARRIIEHNLVELLSNPAVTVTLSDPDHEGGDIDLRRILTDEYDVNEIADKFSVEGYKFDLRHITVKSSAANAKHRVLFCAKRRSVETRGLSSIIPHLSGPLPINGMPRVYVGALTGEYFEEHVNPTRTAIVLDDDDHDAPSIIPTVSEDKIMSAVRKSVLAYLQKPLEEIKQVVKGKVSGLIHSTAPEYRGVIERKPEVLDRLSPSSSEADIISTLATERFRERKEYLDNISSILSKASSQDHLAKIKKESLEAFYKGAHEEAAACMIKFVHHRRSVLDLLNLYLGTQICGKHETEAAIHNLIFPMKNTSDSFPVDYSNLWVIDERLVFHHYLASDLPFTQHAAISSGSEKRSDITVYHSPDDKFWDAAFALTENDVNFPSVTIIEFKKPDRDNYTRDDNPFNQITNYVLDIRSGKREDRLGRRFPRPKQLRFTAYIILDVTQKLRDLLVDEKGFMDVVDGDGLYKIEPHLNLYVEVMSYQKMIENAKKRNAAYFNSLKLAP